MILAVKVYYEVDTSLNPEQVQEVVRLLQEATTNQVLKSHPFIGGFKVKVKDSNFVAKAKEWKEVKKLLGVKISEKSEKL
jgi:isopropylmalate/homocitrate/citramalate synthase